MTCAIVYSSKTGNTKYLAETIKETLSNEIILYYGPLNDQALKADRIFLGFWTNNGTCDLDTQQFIKKLTNQQIILFGTAGLGFSAQYFDTIISRTRKLFGERVKYFASFMCQGKMPLEARVGLQQLKNSQPNNPKFERLLTNFDFGRTHPNKDDIKNLISWIRKL